MAPPFLDTNVFLRHLTKPDPTQPHLVEQSRRAYALFKRVETGQETVFTIDGVIVKGVQVLSSRTLYNLPRHGIAALLIPLLSLPGIKLPLKHVVLKALGLYGNRNVDFVDALLVAR